MFYDTSHSCRTFSKVIHICRYCSEDGKYGQQFQTRAQKLKPQLPPSSNIDLSFMSRKDKEPTRAQLSSRLAYEQHVPAFLQKLQNKISGISNEEDEDEAYDEEWEHINDGSGRPPIPRRRPPIPERPADDPGSDKEDEERGDEKPQVIVLREGKHLTEREAENIRRKEKGLPPVPDVEKPPEESSSSNKKEGNEKPKASAPSLSFSSSTKSVSSKSFKRKVLGGDSEPEDDQDSQHKAKKSEPPKKKSKKSTKSKKLLSFGDDT
ncbi:hypothetical protein E1B28_011655 [Marasmius oreades]|uniref:DUF4604 domain-containing protein n=1 Tax=Marasmius oreades TaxID=181124 RepID=A0A9P7UQG0_9AGAR|nr:uncharacterized protein E1B28_011655 [Marasmius oreades]KAG7090035.1 hypothetical protein E1B28_011655 [Marasmius oreades]